MGVTYTTALERDAQRQHGAAGQRGVPDIRLALISTLAVCLSALAYHGRFATIDPSSPVTHLNRVADARTLEPVLAPLFETPADATLAARELFGFLVLTDGVRRTMPNVGALLQARVPAPVIEAAGEAAGFRRRLAEQRARSAALQRDAPDSIPVLTPAQLAELKPSVVVRERGDARRALLLWGGVYLAAVHLVPLAWRRRGIRGDPPSFIIAHLLTAIGFAAMVSRPDPLRDVLLFVRFSQGVSLGLVVAACVSFLNVRTAQLAAFSYVPLVGALVLSAILILFGSGPGGSDAKVNLGPVQPIEAIRLLLALFLAGYFARHWEILRGVRERAIGGIELPGWLDVPRLRYGLPVVAGVGAALALFFLQRDMGPALMLALVFLATWAVARGRAGMVLVGLAMLCAGFYVGHQLGISSTLAARVQIWQSPWDNAARGGDQIAHALWAAATGGPLGAGLGLGDPRYVPAGDTDLVLAGVAEELGIIGLLVVAALYVALVGRAMSTALRASTDYGFFLAVILALFFAIPVLLVAAGLLGVVPLTGVVTPFLSFGGSAMVANFAALGLLASLRSDERPAADLAIFRPAVRLLGLLLAAGAAGLLVTAFRVQVLHADETAIRPHLGLQADGVRRYQHNPRVLDAVRLLPRGSILDRQGLPLATEDRALLARARDEYTRLGIDIASVCADASARCYPLGGRAFHVLGDAGARTNWSASNTSFVERDSESRLRGFDDHQTIVRIDDDSGVRAVRRDYRDILPVLRQRRRPDHPAVETMLARPRDVRVTLDARLQVVVAAILARHASSSGSGQAAAIVLDPGTGDLLASVSYPWPATPPGRDGDAGMVASALLDRARYGLYPPGSTFKLVTAAAALLSDSGAAKATFTCARLEDGRVGARIKGWARPVRDDVLDRQPHGSVGLHRGLVVSCNAYFAQLAASLGADAMRVASDRAGVPLAPGNASTRVKETLPQAGYGQGDVLASPLRMARIAAAIAADGTLRDVRIARDDPPPAASEFLPVGPARRLGSFMRDAVVSGTGRSLRGEATPIAGKTGTAEVAGAPSHAWFVGFAPYGPAKARVAVAVIVENAGYGGVVAAPLAGEIIGAAAALGLVR